MGFIGNAVVGLDHNVVSFSAEGWDQYPGTMETWFQSVDDGFVAELREDPGLTMIGWMETGQGLILAFCDPHPLGVEFNMFWAKDESLALQLPTKRLLVRRHIVPLVGVSQNKRTSMRIQ